MQIADGGILSVAKMLI